MAHTIAGVAAAIDHVLGERKRKISGQLNTTLTRERRRAIWLGPDEIQADVEHDGKAIVVTFEDGARHVLSSNWIPGMPVWAGTIDGAPVAMHVRAMPNGFELAYHGIEVKAFVYTEREARYARLMPVKKLSDSGKAVRCPMPGLVVSLAVSRGPGGQSRRDAGRGRGHEDGKHFARRARRHHQENPRQTGRQRRR